MQILKTRPDGYIWVEKKKTYGINKIYFKIIYKYSFICGGTRWRIQLRHYATSLNVAGSIPDGVAVNFH